MSQIKTNLVRNLKHETGIYRLERNNVLPTFEATHQWCKKGGVFHQNVLLQGEFGNQQFHQDSPPVQQIFEMQQKLQICDEVECKLCYNQLHANTISPLQGCIAAAVLFCHSLFLLILQIPVFYANQNYFLIQTNVTAETSELIIKDDNKVNHMQ